MINPYPIIKARNEELRQRLNKLHACLTDCLFALGQQESFYDMCSALVKESDAMIRYLGELEEQYQEDLPLDKDEPKNVDWEEERERLMEFSDELMANQHYMGSEFPKSLSAKLKEISDSMKRIDEGLYPENDSDIYSSYSKRELEAYTMAGWNRDAREIRNQLAKPTNAHRPDYCKEQLAELLNQLRNISGYLLNEESNVIFHEGLGRLLWQIRHDKSTGIDMKSILYVVKGIEFYSAKVGSKLTFLDFESSPNEEIDECIRLENLKQETLQNQQEKIAFRLCRCEQYLNKDFSTQWIREMLTNLINSDHSAQVCEKMKNRKLAKFTHQIVGVLKDKDVFVECCYGDLVDVIAFTKPRRDSRIDYIRHMVNDEPEIQTWLETYIANYREQLRRQTQ